MLKSIVDILIKINENPISRLAFYLQLSSTGHYDQIYILK